LQLRAVNFDEQRGQYSDASSVRCAVTCAVPSALSSPADPSGTLSLHFDAVFDGSIPAAPQRDVYNIFRTIGKASQVAPAAI
jgi:hypothetical protein